MRTFGSIVELYLAKIFDVVTMMAGGEVKRPQQNQTVILLEDLKIKLKTESKKL